MGIWSKVTSFFGGGAKPQAPTGPIPELVILLSEPLIPTVEFVHGGVEHALQVPLSIGDPNSTEFVAGEPPIFFMQYRGWILQIKTMHKPYLASECRPFVNGNLETLAKTADAVGAQGALSRHQGWISVAVMNGGPGVPLADCYYYIGKIIGAFALQNVMALVWPVEAKIAIWKDEYLVALMDGKPLQVFGV